MVPNDASWWRALAVAAICLVLSALAWGLGFSAYLAPRMAHPGVGPVTWTGAMLQTVEGEGHRSGTDLILTGLSGARQAMAVADPVHLEADKVPFLTYRIRGLRPGTEGVFFWRSDQTSGFQSVALQQGVGESGTLMLAGNRFWKGDISAFGTGLVKELSEPVAIESLEFRPFSTGALISTLWTDWTAFRDWGQQSVNFNPGTSQDPVLRPSIAVTAWIGLALLLYGCWAFFRRLKPDWRVGVTVFLTGWLVLEKPGSDPSCR